jgi:hypothetical protein
MSEIEPVRVPLWPAHISHVLLVSIMTRSVRILSVQAFSHHFKVSQYTSSNTTRLVGHISSIRLRQHRSRDHRQSARVHLLTLPPPLESPGAPHRATHATMSSYYNIDTILTDAQKVPCTFELTIPGLGYLEGNPGSAVTSGTKLELPLWLAEMLAVSANISTSTVLTLDLPSALSSRVLNALKADPRTLDLRSLAPHFYALGARMLELFEEDEVGEVLAEVSRAGDARWRERWRG